MNNKYSSNIEYPKVENIVPNTKDLELIQADYSGIISEFTAINQYIYHYLYADKQHQDIAKELLNISFVEMRHLNILGQVIIALGADPKFIIDQTKYWTGDIVNYSKDLISAILSDFYLEEETIKNYKKQSLLVENKQISKILNRLIIDEEMHLKILYQLLVELNSSV